MDHQAMNPPTVDNETNHPKTVLAVAWRLMNERRPKHAQKMTEMRGRPDWVQREKILGAWPRRARPYKIRDAQKRKELVAEKALVKTQALMRWGRP